MKPLRIILPLVALLGVIFLLVKFVPTKKAAIKIESVPQATVFINGKEVGKTPYEKEKAKPGRLDIKLVPEGINALPWEKELVLSPNTRLIMYKKFAENKEEETSKILYLQKSGDKEKASLILSSTPSNVSVSIDGQMRGFSPLNLEDVGSGEHKIVLSYPGYQSEEIIARTLAGYELVVEVKLAKGKQEETQEATGSAQLTEAKEQVLIKDTPTGWLRVRMGPTTAATEAAKVKPGEIYPLLGEEKGWYKIEYKEGKEGWISGRYAQKITPTPQVAPTSSPND